METYIYFIAVLIIMGLISLVTFKMIFKKSLTTQVSIVTLILGETLAFASFAIAKDGYIHLVWAAPTGLIVFIFLMIYISKEIKKISTLANQITEISKGNFNVKIDEKNFVRKDEIGILANAMHIMINNLSRSVKIANNIASGNITIDTDKLSEKNQLDGAIKKMILKLQSIITEIKDATNKLTTNSLEISSSSSQIASGSNEQAASTEEISASMEEMVSNINQNAENAGIAEQIALKVSLGMKESSESFNTTLKAMLDIAQKTSIINEIAQKTDILAINAAIEAARAGEHGRGFAVVASEIRKLAENSQSAATEIDEVVNASVLIAEKSTVLLEELEPDINENSILAQQINAASKEQNIGAEQINNAIQELTKVIQENTESSSSLSDNSNVLTEQAQALIKVINFFQTDNAKINKEEFTTTKKENTKKEEPSTSKNSKNGVTIDMHNSEIDDNKFERF